MTGSFLGSIAALLFLLLFQCAGILISFCAMKEKSYFLKLLCGSVIGSAALQWIPIFFSFLLGFTLAANFLGLLSFLAIVLIIVARGENKEKVKAIFVCDTAVDKKKVAFLVVTFFVFTGLLLHSFREIDGSIHSSQCTYGDMSMHLGFITSIAEQGVFPPEYSILSGVKLAYPFLSDSISSSLYLFGAPLRFAYILPMLLAAIQVFGGALLFFRLWLQDRAKIILAYVFFSLTAVLDFSTFLVKSILFRRYLQRFITHPLI